MAKEVKSISESDKNTSSKEILTEKVSKGFSVNPPKKNKPKVKNKKRVKQVSGVVDLIKSIDGTSSSRLFNNVPEMLRKADGIVNIPRHQTSDRTSTKILLSKVFMEHVKFSPLGEESSIIRHEVVLMLEQWVAQAHIFNVNFSLSTSPIAMDSREYDEYIEICVNYIITYKFMKLLLSISRGQCEAPNPLKVYATDVVRQLGGVQSILTKAEASIKRMFVPPNLMDYLDRNFTIKIVNSDPLHPRVEILGIKIPTQYASYSIEGTNSQFTLSRGPKYPTPSAEFGTQYDFVEDNGVPIVPGYNPNFVLSVPPTNDSDILRIHSLLEYFDIWANKEEGVFRRFGNYFSVVVPSWSLQDSFKYNPVSISVADGAWVTMIENLRIKHIKGGTEAFSRKFGAEEEVEISVHRDRMPSLLYLFSLNLLVFNNNGLPTHFPGLIFRLPQSSELEVDVNTSRNSVYNPRFVFTQTGRLERLTKLEDQLRLNRRFCFDSNNGVEFEFINSENEIRSTSLVVFTESSREFVRYLFNSEDFTGSKTFISFQR